LIIDHSSFDRMSESDCSRTRISLSIVVDVIWKEF
jgi:hypothetical protein